ncbi:hypothetical protein [Streptomyces sp. MP131-18]|uniref:hypothetical protein n=1 Tax=Streptomyces sp. MP131-18 TaxID=1857892 RepID=UPI00097C6115|nr:hypothetical protein [Streptomyces sp. MP131-18]ONK10346.1 hypothetical protein STBA_10680 [Streptomyces sp. MP131-18]
MSARDRLAVMMTTSPAPDGEWSNAEIDAAIDAFAHELAEEVRADTRHIRYGSATDYANRHADLIDPEVKP